MTPGGRGVWGEEGLHIKQCVLINMHLSMAASSHGKPAFATKCPIQHTIFQRTVLKFQPPAAHQISYLLKILFEMWGNTYLKISAI
jgi:hypothetical protein